MYQHPDHMPPRLKMDSGADLNKLTTMIHSFLALAWEEEWKDKFGPEYPKDQEIAAPFIAYKIKSREPTKAHGIKNRFVGRVPAQNETGHEVDLLSKHFDCEIQFDIFHQTAREANQLLDDFEDFLTQYTGEIKRGGIQEFIFLRQLEDDHDFRWRENYYVRSLVYFVRIQKITPIPLYTLNQIEIDPSIMSLYENIHIKMNE